MPPLETARTRICDADPPPRHASVGRLRRRCLRRATLRRSDATPRRGDATPPRARCDAVSQQRHIAALQVSRACRGRAALTAVRCRAVAKAGRGCGPAATSLRHGRGQAAAAHRHVVARPGTSCRKARYTLSHGRGNVATRRGEVCDKRRAWRREEGAVASRPEDSLARGLSETPRAKHGRTRRAGRITRSDGAVLQALSARRHRAREFRGPARQSPGHVSASANPGTTPASSSAWAQATSSNSRVSTSSIVVPCSTAR
jgi:hypothetical protein